MNKKRNLLKTIFFGELLSTCGAVNITSNMFSNATSSIEWHGATSINYTSNSQLPSEIDTQKYLASQNYTGHYDPTKHNHKHNLEGAIQSKIIRAVNDLKNTSNGSVDIYNGSDFGDEISVSVEKVNGQISVNTITPNSLDGVGHAVCKYTVESVIVAIGVA